MLALGEDDTALDLLARAEHVLSRLDDEAPARDRARAELLAERARLLLAGGHAESRALTELADAVRLATSVGPEMEELVVELLVHQGHALLAEGELLDATRVLEEAVERADSLSGEDAPLWQAQANRELGVAYAHDDLMAGLRQLERSEAALEELPQVSVTEKALLISTRAEMLANAGRFNHAIEVLDGSDMSDQPWVALQRAAIYDMASRTQEAYEASQELIERMREANDASDLESSQQLAEILLAQAQRVEGPPRAELAGEVLTLLADFAPLPTRCRRMLARALELRAAEVEPSEASTLLAQRTQLLEALVRKHDDEQDRIELIRTYLQHGDAAMQLDEAHTARARYHDAVQALRRFSPEHSVVFALLPLAHNAEANALASCGLWLEARQLADEAVRAVSPRLGPEALADFGEIFLFRAVASLNIGDAEGAVEGLRRAVSLLLSVLVRDSGEGEADVYGPLVDTVINLCVLQAEILVDHLDRVDEAAQSYDQAINLCRLGDGRPSVHAAILGAKAAMLSEHGRPEDAIPLLRLCLELFEEHGVDETLPGQGDLAYALVNLAGALNLTDEPREALEQIKRADGLLDPEQDGGEDEARREAIRSLLFRQRGEALLRVGHPLLAADDFTRSIDICRELLEDGGESRYEAMQQLPLSLLRRAKCWLISGADHMREAKLDLNEARRRYEQLLREEGRPEHERRLEELEDLLGLIRDQRA
ncbi:MAG: hypothetical protein KDD82_14255 [Planctomycetes bacterium]|nr:hypothetical protein [Planctomycetota bacterium]